MQSSYLGSSLRASSSASAVAFTGRRPALASVTVRAAYGDLPKIGGGRKWKHIETNDNGNPVKVPMHVKKGDLVQVSKLAACGSWQQMSLLTAGGKHLWQLVANTSWQLGLLVARGLGLGVAVG